MKSKTWEGANERTREEEEKKKKKKKKKRGNTNTDTEISYTNKQKDDLGCCSLTEHALFSKLLKVTSSRH